MKPTDLMEQNEHRHARLCRAHSKRSGKLCERWAMRGQSICATHGGKSPQALTKAAGALEKADMRLRGLAPDAVDAIERLLKAESEAVILAAAKDILDRGWIKGGTPDRSGHRDHGYPTLVSDTLVRASCRRLVASLKYSAQGTTSDRRNIPQHTG